MHGTWRSMPAPPSDGGSLLLVARALRRGAVAWLGPTGRRGRPDRGPSSRGLRSGRGRARRAAQRADREYGACLTSHHLLILQQNLPIQHLKVCRVSASTLDSTSVEALTILPSTPLPGTPGLLRDRRPSSDQIGPHRTEPAPQLPAGRAARRQHLPTTHIYARGRPAINTPVK
eukprot:COSAG02_NODE_1968_length_10205_cov_11.178120_1_plen_174_part_00